VAIAADDVGEVVRASTEVCVVLDEALEVSGALADSSLLHPATVRLNAAQTATADILVWFTGVLVW
jgi:hypothetical protein